MLNKTKAVLVAAACCLMLGSVAYAQNVIDQSNPSVDAFISFTGGPALAQSFQQSHDNISGAGILLGPFGISGFVTISLWNNLPTAGGTELASGTTVGTEGTYADVFWNPVTIVPDTTYYLVLNANPAFAVGVDLFNSYPNGELYAGKPYQPVPDDDFTFRTYYSSIPDAASTLGLLSTAVAGIVGLKRKKA
jgi:hypothetical protein